MTEYVSLFFHVFSEHVVLVLYGQPGLVQNYVSLTDITAMWCNKTPYSQWVEQCSYWVDVCNF